MIVVPSTAANARSEDPVTDAVVRTAPAYHRDLNAAFDPALQRSLQRYVSKLNLSAAVAQKRLAVSLVDITDLSHPRLAQLNGDEMMYAASLPKIAILFGAYHKLAAGKLKMTDYLRQQMTDMIRVSSNEAATYVFKQVGPGYLARALQSDRYRLYDPLLNGGLWVGKAYASDAAYQRDPLHNISHGATAYQVARFYYMLETGRLVSPEASREMKAIMSNPGIQHKFVAGLRELYPHVDICRKSGTWRTTHADSAIVEHDGRRYIAVALADDPRGGEWLKSLIVAMDNIVSSQPAAVQAAYVQ